MIIQEFQSECAALQFVADFLDCIDTPLHDNAVIFDIDDTILASTTGQPNPTIALFWSMCGTLHLKRFIVTARPDTELENGERNLAVTVDDLHQNGIREWDGLFLMPMDEWERCDGDASAYKHRVRKHIIKTHNGGVPLLLTIGDQWSDLVLTTNLAGRKWEKLDTQGIHVGFFDDTAVLGIKLPRPE